MREVLESREYRAIAAWYGERVARRSGVRLMAHIDEGLAVLAQIGASIAAMRAFCLHPLVQADSDLAVHGKRIEELTDDVAVVMLAFEYRNIANATLSTRTIESAADIPLSPLADVNAMLVADKVQNRKDFIAHHRGKHPRSEALDRQSEPVARALIDQVVHVGGNRSTNGCAIGHVRELEDLGLGAPG